MITTKCDLLESLGALSREVKYRMMDSENLLDVWWKKVTRREDFVIEANFQDGAAQGRLV